MLELAKHSHRLYKLGTNNIQVTGETPSSFSVSPTGYGPDILTNKLIPWSTVFLEKLTVPKLVHKLFYMTISLTVVFANPVICPSLQPDKSSLSSAILHILILSCHQNIISHDIANYQIISISKNISNDNHNSKLRI